MKVSVRRLLMPPQSSVSSLAPRAAVGIPNDNIWAQSDKLEMRGGLLPLPFALEHSEFQKQDRRNAFTPHPSQIVLRVYAYPFPTYPQTLRGNTISPRQAAVGMTERKFTSLLRQCHGSSCCACSVDLLPRSGITVGHTR